LQNLSAFGLHLIQEKFIVLHKVLGFLLRVLQFGIQSRDLNIRFKLQASSVLCCFRRRLWTTGPGTPNVRLHNEIRRRFISNFTTPSWCFRCQCPAFSARLPVQLPSECLLNMRDFLLTWCRTMMVWSFSLIKSSSYFYFCLRWSRS
jgi:hypothetical protein